MARGTKVVLGVLAVAALGACAWWLWPASSETAGASGDPAATSAERLDALAVRKVVNALAEAELAPPRGELKLRGRVLHEGQPVPGALVVATGPEAEDTLAGQECKCGYHCGRKLLECGCGEAANQLLALVMARKGEPVPLARTTTGADGTFELHGLEAGTVSLWAEKAGAGIARRDGVAVGSEVDVVLEPAVTLAGTLKDEDGEPVPLGVITAIHQERSRYFDTQADAEGRFNFPLLPEGKFRLVATAEGFLPEADSSPAPSKEPVEIELQRPRRLEGHVTRDGTPAAGVTVSLDGQHRKERITTSDDGSFAFELLRPGTYQLEAISGDRGVRTEVELSAPVTTTDLTLDFAREVIVHVTSTVGGPVADAEIQVRAAIPHLAQVPEVKTGPDGTARMTLFQNGQWSVSASAHGYAHPIGQTLEISGPRTTTLTFELTPAAVLSGVVVDEAGAPIEGATISLRDEDHSSFETTDAKGVFAVDELLEGEYDFAVTDERHASLTGKVRLPAQVRWVMPRGATLHGRVIDAEGQPVPGVRVGANPDYASFARPSLHAPLPESREARTDANGRFTFEGLADGDYTAFAARPGAESNEKDAPPEIGAIMKPFSVKAGQTPELVIQFEAGSEVDGIVVDMRGRPVAKAQIALVEGERSQWAASGSTYTATSGPDGTFRLNGVTAGRYTALATAEWVRPDFAYAVTVEVPTSGPIKLRTPASRHVRGRVVDEKGVGLTAQVMAPGGRTDSKGRFDVVLPPDWDRLAISAQQYALRTIDLEPSEESIDVGDVVMSRGRVIEGRVETPTAAPANRASVEINFGDDLGAPPVNTDAQGRFRIEQVPEVEVQLTASHLDFAPARATVGADTRSVVLRLNPAARVAGVVLEADGTPAQKGEIDVESSGGTVRIGMVGKDGTYEVTGVPPGPAWVSVQLDDGPSYLSRHVDVAAGETLRVDFKPSAQTCDLVLRMTQEMDPWAILLEGDQPLPGNLKAWREAQGAQTQGTQGPEGVTFRAVPQGHYTLFVIWRTSYQSMRVEKRLVDVGTPCPAPLTAVYSADFPLLK